MKANGTSYGMMHWVIRNCVVDHFTIGNPTFFKVSTKQSEFGIGQHGFDMKRIRLVDYLPYMHSYQWILQSRLPRPVASYDTIVNPFDYITWVFTLLSIVMQFLLLLVMQNVWSRVTGRLSPEDYIFEGW